MSIQHLVLLLCLLILYPDTCLCQRDCTGVDCPVLQNCIEEVLQQGTCCATCMKTGCACEGYQYYDCVHAGFRKGKVPEGESYFVDFGSTECSCPQGGGRISCRFIPCPDIPPNCISVSQPADGCQQCERIGCVHGNRKYEAGHSFQMHPCQVCHCPNDGRRLMCSPIPDCDPRSVTKPELATTTENSSPLKDSSSPYVNRQANPLDPLSRLHKLPGNTLPLYKEDPPSLGRKVDYDYSPVIATSTNPPPHVQPLESTSVPDLYLPSSSPNIFDKDLRQELRERLGTHDQDRMGPRTESLQNMNQTPSRTATPTRGQEGTPESYRHLPELGVRDSRDQVTKHTLKEVKHAVGSDTEAGHTAHPNHREGPHSQDGGHASQGHRRNEKVSVESSQPQEKQEQPASIPTVQFRPTSRAPVKLQEEGEQKPGRQAQTLSNYQPPEREGDSDAVSAKELVEMCCETGEKWASANGHCNITELPTADRHSICRTAQRQCCLGSLKESRCFAGLNAAREGVVCDEGVSDHCGADSYKECCSCCSLGLHFRSEGHRCEAHQYLGYPCSHVFLTCCEGEDGARQEQDGLPLLREMPTLDPTARPVRVSDSPFPKEAFSIGEEGQENTAEGPPEVEDVDECQVYQGTLCHQGCVNTAGSYRCTCYPGYALQMDGSRCVPDMVDEENRLREDDKPAVGSTSPPSTSQPHVQLDPCEGNGTCMQQCTPVAGKPQCSCFPGFSLTADGQSCQDINECLSLRACQLNERCMNTAGSFVCQRQITCPLGFQINKDMCEDIDECAERTQTCGLSFECVNTEGSFRCNPRPRCPTGFSQGTNGSCMDIDECVTLGRPCSPGFNCLNTVGSYSCQRKIIMCSRGYHASPDGSRCIDVDECQNSLHQCGEGQLCHNLPGSYRCDCQAGYQYDMFRKMCVDVNECWRYPGRLCAQTCENTPGSYQCSCTVGFRLSTDGKNCEDVNECLTNPCSQECANLYGSYQCYCLQGYHLREDGHSCEDIDECSQSMGHLCTYKCVNVPGSYQCACPEYGYTMSPDGHSCRDVDECTMGNHNCSLAETCYNIQGGFRCLSFDCPQNYRRVSDTRCERRNCPNYLDCQNSPLRITYYHLSFQSNILIPAQIFRIGPSPAYSGDNVIISITQGNEENYFSTRKLNAYTGAVYLHQQVREPQDFLIDVEMKLWRQGTFTTFLARIYVFITANSL
ncbi:fibulin-2-like isoform X1 [Hypomesus transpacificus]|uniref:fibulin-2-like isoform X1 n=1 Tax=Hypomesus transpacificus TaxID=137520 RepID=UPI001F087DD9|nr:fibulin-2-like isoform X1 [Hypomesus transpacificus]